MKLNDLFRKKNDEEQNDLNTNIKFNDVELQITIGQWLGLLSDMKKYGGENFSIYTHLSADELRRKTTIPKERFDEIDKRFRTILSMAGINSTEICILDNFNKKKFTFTCHLEKENSDALIKLRWGDWLDFLPEFTIDYNNEKKLYEYINLYEDNTFRFKLYSYNKKNIENNNTCHRIYSPYTYYFNLENNDYSLQLQISNVYIDDYISNYTFTLNNEKELEKYLLSLEFPIQIDEVYKKINEITLNSIHKYPKFTLSVSKKINDENKKITDNITLKEGKLEEFTITKNGKTISIKEDNSWSYDSDKLYVHKDEEDNIGFNHKKISKTEISSLKTIGEEIDLINNDIEEVKKLSKTF